jgi:hypothetical protein
MVAVMMAHANRYLDRFSGHWSIDIVLLETLFD